MVAVVVMVELVVVMVATVTPSPSSPPPSPPFSVFVYVCLFLFVFLLLDFLSHAGPLKVLFDCKLRSPISQHLAHHAKTRTQKRPLGIVYGPACCICLKRPNRRRHRSLSMIGASSANTAAEASLLSSYAPSVAVAQPPQHRTSTCRL